MIAKDLVTEVKIVSHYIQQITTMAHVDDVSLIKFILSLPSASNLNDWRMVLDRCVLE